MRLAVVADEIGTSIEEQIDSLKKANISNIELMISICGNFQKRN